MNTYSLIKNNKVVSILKSTTPPSTGEGEIIVLGSHMIGSIYNPTDNTFTLPFVNIHNNIEFSNVSEVIDEPILEYNITLEFTRDIQEVSNSILHLDQGGTISDFISLTNGINFKINPILIEEKMVPITLKINSSLIKDIEGKNLFEPIPPITFENHINYLN